MSHYQKTENLYFDSHLRRNPLTGNVPNILHSSDLKAFMYTSVSPGSVITSMELLCCFPIIHRNLISVSFGFRDGLMAYIERPCACGDPSVLRRKSTMVLLIEPVAYAKSVHFSIY